MSQPKILGDAFKTAGYSSEEAYFFDLNRKNLIDFKQKLKEAEERKQKAGEKREASSSTGADVVEFPHKKAA